MLYEKALSERLELVQNISSRRRAQIRSHRRVLLNQQRIGMLRRRPTTGSLQNADLVDANYLQRISQMWVDVEREEVC